MFQWYRARGRNQAPLPWTWILFSSLQLCLQLLATATKPVLPHLTTSELIRVGLYFNVAKNCPQLKQKALTSICKWPSSSQSIVIHCDTGQCIPRWMTDRRRILIELEWFHGTWHLPRFSLVKIKAGQSTLPRFHDLCVGLRIDGIPGWIPVERY